MRSHAVDRRRVDPDSDAYHLNAIYGAVMGQVQSFEVVLAALALALEADPTKTSNASLRRQIRKAIKTARHAFQSGSAAASRDRLKGRIDEDLYEVVDSLVSDRNRLAHSFLVEQLIDVQGTTRFRPGTALQLVEYVTRFGAGTRRVVQLLEETTAGFPSSSDEKMTTLGEEIGRALILGEPLGRTAGQQSSDS
jgi:hypothetical protein